MSETTTKIRAQHGLDLIEVEGPLTFVRDIYDRWREKMDQQDVADREIASATMSALRSSPTGRLDMAAIMGGRNAS